MGLHENPEPSFEEMLNFLEGKPLPEVEAHRLKMLWVGHELSKGPITSPERSIMLDVALSASVSLWETAEAQRKALRRRPWIERFVVAVVASIVGGIILNFLGFF